LTEHIYPGVKEAVLALVRIFGPAYVGEIRGELRSLIHAKAVANLPEEFVKYPRGITRSFVIDQLEELWVAGEVIQVDDHKWKAA